MSDDEASMSDTVPPEPAKQVYDQAFFLDLARPKPGETQEQVRERWNAWRRDPVNADVAVTFDGVDFRTEENRGIWFDGFEFGDDAQFDGAMFGDSVAFSGATFGAQANFRSATFGEGALFTDTTFGDWPVFTDATFGDGAWFEGATFGRWAQFDGASFGEYADFSGQTGERDIAARLKEWGDLDEVDRHRREIRYREWRETWGIGPSTFSSVDFTSARFLGQVSFARRSFERTADFLNACFDRPPDFDRVANLQSVDFTGARVGFVPADRPWWKPHWTTDSTVAIHLRALRSQIEATKNHDFERDLYIEERKAERGIYFDRYLKERRWSALAGHCLWIAVMAVYWAFSDYGRSWLRPAIWLGASIPAFHLLYAHLLADRREIAVASAREAVTKTGEGKDALVVVKGWQAAEGRVLADYDATVGQLAVSNAVPFVGPLTIDGDAKKFLYCGVWPTGKGETIAASVVEPCRPIPPPGFQAAMISQNLLSILLVFFIGLALRNYFRVK
jgi:uncharacterized protein YjbI with pentapeptide repeats